MANGLIQVAAARMGMLQTAADLNGFVEQGSDICRKGMLPKILTADDEAAKYQITDLHFAAKIY